MKSELKKTLSARHIGMIALGGSIGTGLFITSGASIATAGPIGTLFAYALISIMVFFVMTSLLEMAAHSPCPGSFCTYSSRYVNAGFGKAMSVNYYFSWASALALELSAIGIIMQFWFPNTPILLWTGLFFVLMIIANIFKVRVYAEFKYWITIIKISAIILFLIIGTLLIFGVIGTHPIGFDYWIHSHFSPSNGLTGIFVTFIYAALSFQGTELFGVAAGEAKNPEKTLPKASRTIFWRIIIFYLCTMAVIGLLIPHTDPRLLNADQHNIAMSPFTIIFNQVGFKYAASFMNFIILVAIFDAANSDLYSATRILFAMAENKEAPALFTRLSKHGVPFIALAFTALFGAASFLMSVFGSSVVFLWLVNLSTLAGIIAWIGIAISHYKFRDYLKMTNQSLKSLPYLAKAFPFGPLFAVTVCCIVIAGQWVVLAYTHQLTLTNVLSTYTLLPILIWIGWRENKKQTKTAAQPMVQT